MYFKRKPGIQKVTNWIRTFYQKQRVRDFQLSETWNLSRHAIDDQ